VDVERFERELPTLFEHFPESAVPRDRRFREVLDGVEGLTRENNLALLNLAAACVEAGETYVEVGSYRGTSLIAAMLGNDCDVVAIDDFSLGDGNRGQLVANLERFGLEPPAILEGDAIELVRGGALAGRRVGAYYYDAGHTYEEQLDGLRVVEPYLAERALLIVDDSDWKDVARAGRDYLAGESRARLLLELPGKKRGAPQWWEGVQVIAWQA
jgi:hypothetical protein